MYKLFDFIYYLLLILTTEAIWFASLFMIINLRGYYFVFNAGLVLNLLSAYGMIHILTNPPSYQKTKESLSFIGKCPGKRK